MATTSTMQRILGLISMIVSGLVLLLALGGIIGAWSLRGTTIQVSTGILEGVDQLAQVGRNNIARLDTRLSQLETAVGEVIAAADQIKQNVEDKGVVMVLLPPEKEQQLENTTQQISDGLAAVKDTIEAVREIKQTIDRIPFVDLPELDPAKVAATEESIDSLRSGVTELKNDVRQFREGSAAEISKISTAAENVGNRLTTSRDRLAEVDDRLEALQNGATQLVQSAPIYINTIVVVLTLVLAWVVYAMVVLIRQSVAQLRG
jgi:uncharacterized phage infection (PIP) family protein YhgE